MGNKSNAITTRIGKPIGSITVTFITRHMKRAIRFAIVTPLRGD
jgi:hypothetical protein